VIGRLFLVATPIGNPDDLAPRAADLLRAVPLIAAEDTRTARALLARLGRSSAEIWRCDDHVEGQVAAAIVARLTAGDDVALVSDAGTPLCSDPGFRVVRAALAGGIAVVPVPGPSAVMAALTASGLPTDRFTFVGFPPRQAGARAGWLAGLAREEATLVLYESPHRIADTLADAAAAWGERPACLAISLTKVWERFHRGTLAEVRAALLAEGELKGEMTLVVAGNPDVGGKDRAAVEAVIRGLAARGVPASDLRDVVADAFGWSRRDVYQLALSARPARE
jgi:16S rRNA (cytidine1402-2'-O)-methyltransferase